MLVTDGLSPLLLTSWRPLCVCVVDLSVMSSSPFRPGSQQPEEHHEWRGIVVVGCFIVTHVMAVKKLGFFIISKKYVYSVILRLLNALGWV